MAKKVKICKLLQFNWPAASSKLAADITKPSLHCTVATYFLESAGTFGSCQLLQILLLCCVHRRCLPVEKGSSTWPLILGSDCFGCRLLLRRLERYREAARASRLTKRLTICLEQKSNTWPSSRNWSSIGFGSSSSSSNSSNNNNMNSND